MKFYNNVVEQKYESAICGKSKVQWEKNLLRNEKLGVGQNSTKFIASVDGCKKSDDIVKCESCLATVNNTLKFAAGLLSFINSERKVL